MLTIPEETQVVSRDWLEKRLEGINVILGAHLAAIQRQNEIILDLQEELAELKENRVP